MPYWTYNGKPITIKFIIRVDDPQGRLPAGRYVADQLEKAGIKVERLEYDRSKAGKMVYGGDPAAYEWTMYTEGWGAGATRRWWDVSICQMYAPYYGYMPGGATEGFWNYQQDEIDKLAQKSYNGWFLTAEEYWNDNLKAQELGLTEAVRIWVCSQMQYYVANKDRVTNRFAYGLGDGLNGWSFITADVKPNDKGEKILRVTQYSAKGGLFMSAWDPVGVDGFSDVYASFIVDECTMREYFEAPNTAADTPYLLKWDLKDVKTNVGPDTTGDGKPEGIIDVPANAVKYDSATKTWEKVGPGVKSYSTAKYTDHGLHLARRRPRSASPTSCTPWVSRPTGPPRTATPTWPTRRPTPPSTRRRWKPSRASSSTRTAASPPISTSTGRWTRTM